MNTATCPDCGAALPAGAPAGLCAACLLSLGEQSSATGDVSTLIDQSPSIETPGTRIGRYKLLEPIGEGGFGTVWMAEQEEPVRRRVALKIIKLGMDTRAVVARFEAERQALALMDHPHIAKVLDGGATETGRPYFVMELVRGVPITEYCDGRKLNTRERLELFIPVCQAVQHAHQKGIIHRDLKPSNILVTEQDGRAMPKVIDFGIAKATEQKLTEKTLFTRFNQMIGTPAYMSPEQAGLGGLDIDTRSDIYSLGVLLYELLIGRTPFDHRKLMEAGFDAILKTIRETEPPKASTRLSSLTAEELTVIAARRSDQPAHLNKLLRGELDWILLKTLEKDRNRRYDTANGLAADINRYLANEPVSAVAPSTAYRLQKWAGRNRLAVGAVGIVAAALVIGLGISTWALFGERKARERAEAAEHEQSLARTQAVAASQVANRERAQANEAREAVSVERDRAARLLSQSQAEVGVRLLEQEDPVGLLHLLEARKTVEHLPEERLRRTLLWSGWMNSLPKAEVKVIEMPGQSGDWVQLISNPINHTLGQPWMATGSTNGEIILWEFKTGKQITKFTTGNQRVGSPEFSANGRLLMVNAGGTFQLWNLAPVLTNQPPVRLARRIFRHAFDAKHLRVVTFANEGWPVPGEPNTDLPIPVSQVQVWDSSAEPALVSTWEEDRSDLSNHHFALSADGLKIVTGWESLKVWDAKTGRQIEPTLRVGGPGNQRRLTDQLFQSPDGRWLWEIMTGTCQRYDLSTGQPVGDPIGNLHRWNPPWVSPSGQHLILSLVNGFQVVDLDTGGSMGPLIARDDDALRAIALSADGGKLAIAGPDRAVRVWDTRSGQQLGRTLMPPARIASAAFSPDGNWLSMAGGDGRLRMHSLTPQPSAWVKEWAGVKVIGFNQQGELLTYEIGKRTMEWRRPGTDQVSLAWPVPDSGVLIGSALNPDGAMAAAVFRTGKMQSLIHLWDTTTGRLLEPAITWTNVGVLAFSPDGRTLAGLGGEDGSGSIQLWDVASRQPKAFLASRPMQVSWLSLRYSPDGRFIAARNSYAMSVWDVATGRLASGANYDAYLAISADWKWALGQDLLDFTDPRQPRPAPHPATSRNTPAARGGLGLSADGRLRVSESANKTFRLWDNLTGRPVGQEMKLAHMLRQAEFSPDSRLLVGFEWNLGPSGPGPKMSIRLWDTSTGLPCGPPVPLALLPVDFLFDRDIRFLAVTAPFDNTTSIIFALPDREIPLTEMERQSWLLSGSRLDESGNLEVLTLEEIQRLEAGIPNEEPPAKPQQQAAAATEAPKSTVPQAPTSTLPLEIQSFIVAHEERARVLAAQRNRSLPAALTNYFAAARAGDWTHASNAFASFSRQLEQGPFDDSSALLFILRQAALDSYITLEHFSRGSPRLATDFGRGIVASLPAGSIYFGGTDPGRGLVTAFAHARTNADAIFVLTQNALADNSYLDYVRDAHGRHIQLPTAQDSQSAFQEYLTDAQRRLEHDQKFPAEPKQLKPGEDIQIVGGRVQVSGQVAVMAINALLAKRIFDLNPEREFYLEESFPLEWMQPHLEPHGLILKLNRQPLPELTPAMVNRDREFWVQRLRPFVGDWLREETSPKEVTDFIERVFVRKDLAGFTGDRSFVSDPLATKAFLRLRVSIASHYRWRAHHTRDEAERARMVRAADFAFRQSLALCPYSPEAFVGYTGALVEDGRAGDALSIALAVVRFPQTKVPAERLIQELEAKR